MKISTRSRYGMRFMLELAMSYEGGERRFLKDIAHRQGISEKYLSQIAIPLKRADLIITYRGAHGGYALSRRPSEISAFDIVSALEKSIIGIECIKNNSCIRIDHCKSKYLWADLTDACKKTLERTSLASLIERG